MTLFFSRPHVFVLQMCYTPFNERESRKLRKAKRVLVRVLTFLQVYLRGLFFLHSTSLQRNALLRQIESRFVKPLSYIREFIDSQCQLSRKHFASEFVEFVIIRTTL